MRIISALSLCTVCRAEFCVISIMHKVCLCTCCAMHDQTIWLSYQISKNINNVEENSVGGTIPHRRKQAGSDWAHTYWCLPLSVFQVTYTSVHSLWLAELQCINCRSRVLYFSRNLSCYVVDGSEIVVCSSRLLFVWNLTDAVSASRLHVNCICNI